MASERFKVLIGELPPEEAKREYTKKEKAKNFWFYNKWYFIGGTIALIVIISSVISIVNKVKPDYTIGLISATSLPDELMKALGKSIEPFADDRNADGQVVVQVSQYNLSFSETGSENEDPNMRIANVTRLMGDLQTGESMIYIVDDVVALQQAEGFLGYNDGTSPVEGEEVDYEKMGVRWAQSQVLMELDIGKIPFYGVDDPEQYPDGQVFMDRFTIALRTFDTSEYPEKENSKYFVSSQKLFEKLTEY